MGHSGPYGGPMNLLVIGDGRCLFNKPTMIRVQRHQRGVPERLESTACFWVYNRSMTKGRGGFKNVKLGKNVYRQLKRRGPPHPLPTRDPRSDRRTQSKNSDS